MSQTPKLGRKQQVAALALVAAFVGGALYARSALGIEWSVESVRELVDQLGWWGRAGFVLLVAFRTPLLLPSQLVLTVGGLCFGVAGGTVYGGLGIFLSGLFAFIVTRWLGADRIRERVPAGLRRTLEMGGTRGGAAVLAVATGYPVGPIAILHAAAAVTGMAWSSFLVAAAVGSTLRAALWAYFGNSLIEGRWLQVGLAAVVVGLSMLPMLHPRVRAFLKSQLEADPAPTDPADVDAPGPEGAPRR